MHNDNEPSMVCLTYSTPEAFEQLLKEAKKRGIPTRVWNVVDFTIPMNEKYDDTINFFKHFIMPDYWKDRTPMRLLENLPFMIRGTIMNQLAKATLKPLKIDWESWENDRVHPLLYSLVCPLFYQDHSMHMTTEEEKKNFEKFKNFQSEGYKSNNTKAIVLKEEDFTPPNKETTII